MMEKHADLDGYSSAEIVEQLANKILAPILDSALNDFCKHLDEHVDGMIHREIHHQ